MADEETVVLYENEEFGGKKMVRQGANLNQIELEYRDNVKVKSPLMVKKSRY